MKIRFLLTIALVACGGGSSKPSTTPIANPDPVPMTEPTEEAPITSAPPDPVPADRASVAPAKVKADLLAAELAAYEKAKPVFDANCARCHSKGGKLATDKKRAHFDTTTYPFAGHHAMELGTTVRKVLGIDGSKPTMPADKKGAVKGEDLALIAKWADAFDASHAGGAHEHHEGHKH
jgi:mono/diheme cytochrome c family protein